MNSTHPDRAPTRIGIIGCGNIAPAYVRTLEQLAWVEVAAFADGPTRIRGVGFIRAKESDRLGDLCNEMRRLGAKATETDDGLIIQPAALHGSQVDTHHDHRLAMAFGLIGLRVDDVAIDDPGVVTKSWPGYWDMLRGLQ